MHLTGILEVQYFYLVLTLATSSLDSYFDYILDMGLLPDT